MNGPEEYELHSVGGALRLPNGSVVIGNGGTKQLRVFDSSGRFVRAIGRPGAGPGEFGGYSSLRVWMGPGATLVVEDAGNSRVNIFDSAGVLLNTVRLDPAPRAARAWVSGVFADGSLLGTAPLGELQGPAGSLIVNPFAYGRYDSTGRQLNPLFELPSRPRMVHQFGQITHFPFVPLSPEPLLFADRNLVSVIRSGKAEVEQWTPKGELIEVWRWAPPQQRVADIWGRFKTQDLEQASDAQQRAQYEHYYNEPLPLPALVPAARALLRDLRQQLWIERYRLPWDSLFAWDVLDDKGVWLGTVQMPPGLRVYSIGDGLVLGRWRDSLGVEFVRLHRIRGQ